MAGGFRSLHGHRVEHQIIEERRIKARDAINQNFSILTFLKEWNLHRADHPDLPHPVPNERNAISCPFHGNDEDPSLGIIYDGHAFNCFGCQRKGGYIRFVTYWEKIVCHHDLNYNQVIEKILKENPRFCEELGFSSIFSEIVSEISIEHDENGKLILPTRPERDVQRVSTITLKSIFDGLKEPGEIKAFIELVQRGNSEAFILKQYSGPNIQSLLPTDEIVAGLDALLNGRLEGDDDIERDDEDAL